MNLEKDIENKSFLVSGANGYLGSNMVKFLVKKKCRIFAIYNKSKINIQKNKLVKCIEYDLTQIKSRSELPTNVDFIIHFACNPNDRLSVTQKKRLMLENSLIDFNFFRICEEIKHKKFLYASSSSVYDDNKLRKKRSIPEDQIDLPYNPDGLYGLSKLLSEKLLEDLNLNYTICRIFSVYGNDSNTVINQWDKKIRENQNVEIWGNEKVNRSWLHIEDFVRAMALICIQKTDKKYFNVASDENLSLKQIFNIILQFHSNSSSSYRIRQNLDSGPKNRFGSRDNLNQIGFKQSLYLKDGINLLNS